MLCEMQIASSKNWNQDIMYISNEDKYYTTKRLKYIYIHKWNENI